MFSFIKLCNILNEQKLEKRSKSDHYNPFVFGSFLKRVWVVFETCLGRFFLAYICFQGQILTCFERQMFSVKFRHLNLKCETLILCQILTLKNKYRQKNGRKTTQLKAHPGPIWWYRIRKIRKINCYAKFFLLRILGESYLSLCVQSRDLL